MSKARRKSHINSSTHNTIKIAGLTLNATWDGPGEDLIIPRTNTLAEMRSILAILSFIGVDTNTDITVWPEGELLEDASDSTPVEYYDCLICAPDCVTKNRAHYAVNVHPHPEGRTEIPFVARMEGDTLVLESATRSHTLTRDTPNLKAAVARTVKKLLQ